MRVLCGGEVRQVDLREGAGGLEVVVDGARFRPDVQEAAPGVHLLTDGDARETFHAVRDGDVVHLWWRGQAYAVQEESEAYRAAHRHHGSGGLEAPMPGKVIAVRVEPGQDVTRGQELLVVEAMKMENGIRAPRDGRVKTVSARVGDMVNPGLVLVELEPEG